MKYGLALEGGGVRGAYAIGVWKALRKLGIELCAVAGTSIGAVNGALIAADEYDTAIRLWRGIDAENIVSLPDSMKGESDLLRAGNIPAIFSEIYKNNGIDMLPLEKLLREVIDERKIRNSGIDFGLTLFSLTDKKGIYKFTEEIPDGELTDHILASASILGTKEIDGKTFTDGGLYDNLPVNMLCARGIDNIIAVSVGGVGIKRGYSAAGKNIISIRPAETFSGIMDFDRAGIVRAIDKGYVECLRAFGAAAGEIFSFDIEDYTSARRLYSKELITALEKAAEILDINKHEVYTVDGLKQIVLDGYYALSVARDAPIVKAVKKIENGEPARTKGDLFDAASAVAYFKRRY